jgi:acyl-CoA reductase-like NAD-dependent aldehyde dehydrogenase
MMLGHAAHAADLPAGAVNIVCGYGDDAGAALVQHPGVDQIVFTGSVPTGQAILRAAAERVVPCIMELGGKSAGVVCPDADLETVAASVRTGIYFNAGQVCSAMSRLIVPESRHTEILDRVVALSESLSIGPGIEGHAITPLISAEQRDRVEAYCLGAEQEGARLATGGRRLDDRRGHYMPPTVVDRVQPGMRIAREEVFGPVLAVQTYPDDDTDRAVALANGTDYGLCAGVFTRDLDRAHRIARRLRGGQIYVNEWFAGGVETPFGGVGKSGFGREKGQEALNNYLRTKNVAVRLG